MKKKWYTSKTIWVNVIAAVSLFVTNQFGYSISTETQAGIIAVINIVLRVITKEAIT
mgnify:CR=1 FL=1